jgi:hypothetical protein
MVSSPAPSTYYVNSRIGRNDSTAGNQERPFKTVHFALTQVRYGDQIKLVPGKYNASGGERFPLRILAGVKILADDSLKKEVDRGKGIELQGGGNYLSPSKRCTTV